MKIRIALVIACLAMMAQAKQYQLDEQAATVRLAPGDCALPGVPLGWRAAELVGSNLPRKAGCWFYDADTGVVSVLWADGGVLRLPVLRVRE